MQSIFHFDGGSALIWAIAADGIREEYDHLPEAYERKIWDEKIERTFQFVFEHYAATV